MALRDDLREFVNTFGRNGNDIGEVSFQETGTEDDDTEESLEALYRYLQFEKVLTVGGEMFVNILPENRLEKAKQGWFLIMKNGTLVEDNTNWSAGWVVFANRNDDAIFLDRKNGTVNGSVDKKIKFKLADSLSGFFRILYKSMRLENDKYKFETRTPDEEVKQDFVEDIRLLVQSELSSDSGFIEFFFEY